MSIHHVLDGIHDTLWPSVFLNMKYSQGGLFTSERGTGIYYNESQAEVLLPPEMTFFSSVFDPKEVEYVI